MFKLFQAIFMVLSTVGVVFLFYNLWIGLSIVICSLAFESICLIVFILKNGRRGDHNEQENV
ncbi:hypothetical protein N782_00615 [Pontibacillus yanchengensis Y32]|uniref:Uncharacterized protein n=1 Tax=Pontibacillus yanchengensis Y32 TaxID=1385514 RepID=A0A0A2TKU8_9BACI|nr:hypothetical protein N782_00615 [Pontibacillus yanchengensis Y32]